jgi:uncharacterized protein YbjT (DUF2867 family)
MQIRVAVVGGTGMLGTALVAELLGRRDEVRVLSRGPAPQLPPGATHHRADLATGEGLAEGLTGVEAVVDAANTRRHARAVLVDGTRRLTAAGARAGVRHHLIASIVGCDRVPMGYYRVKAAQEQALAAGPVPWTVLRATQFHPLVAHELAAAARFRVRPTGSIALQPIDVSVVARRLADAVHAAPAGRLPDLAGPEVRTLGELSRIWQRADGRRLLPVRVPAFGRLGRALRDGGLCDPAAATPGPTFAEWLTSRPPPRAVDRRVS